MAGPLQSTYLWNQVHKRVLNAANGCQLGKKKARKSATVEASSSNDRRTRVPGPAATVRPVRPWPYQFLREKNGVAWILTWLAL